jgi:hypothetical protein
MRHLMASAVVFAAVSAAAAAQCPGFIPPTFLNSTSITGNELNIISPTDSTANSPLTPSAQDNQAAASMGEAITFTLSNTQGVAGSPISIAYSFGNPTPAGALPFGNLHLNTGAGLGFLVDGIGLATGQLNPFIAHPGPGFNWAMGTSLSTIPGLGQTCWTLQAALLDATSPFGVRMSNAVLMNIRGGVQSITAPFAPEGSIVTVNATGGVSGVANFIAHNPANSSIPATLSASSGSLAFTVPPGSASGPVTFEYPANPGVPTASDPDDTATWLAVVDPFGVQVNPVPGALALNVSPFNPAERWVSLTNSLATSATIQTYTLSLTAGDVLTVEGYSLDTSRTIILNGFGSTFDPSASQGADLQINMTETTNTMPVVYDQGGIGPFAIQGDDDSGPGFNPRFTFQVRETDTYNLVIGATPPNLAAFVSGDYLLNVRVLSGVPSISKFQRPTVTTQINVRAAGLAVDVIGANFPVGGSVNVILNPVHGLYAPITVTGVVPTSATQLQFIIPTLSSPTRCVGLHTVQIEDAGPLAKSFIWDDSFFAPNGILPELLVVRAPTLTSLAPGGFAAVAATPNTATYGVQGTATVGPAGGFFQFGSNGTQTIYMEVLGTKFQTVGSADFQSLVDSRFETGSPTNGIYQPLLTIFAPGLVPVFAFNDDDGFIPTLYNWPNNFSPGIDLNSAILQPAAGFAGGATATFTALVNSNILWGAIGNGRGYIVNIVVL